MSDLDGIATAIFQDAIAEGRAGELLERLFDGESVTISRSLTGELVFASQDMLRAMMPDEPPTRRSEMSEREIVAFVRARRREGQGWAAVAGYLMLAGVTAPSLSTATTGDVIHGSLLKRWADRKGIR